MPRLDQQFKDPIQPSGIAGARIDDGLEGIDLIAPGGMGQRMLASRHPVDITHIGIDLAVVAEVTEGLGQRPAGQGVGAKTTVIGGIGADKIGILKIQIEPLQHRRLHHALVNHHPRGKRGKVDGIKAKFRFHQSPDLPPQQVKGLFQRIPTQAGMCHHQLLNSRLSLPRHRPQSIRLNGHIAPAHLLPLRASQMVIDQGTNLVALSWIWGQKDHAHRQPVLLRPRDPCFTGPFLQDPPRDGSGDPSPIPAFPIPATAAPVLHANQRLEGLSNQVVAGSPLLIDNEAHSTGIML